MLFIQANALRHIMAVYVVRGDRMRLRALGVIVLVAACLGAGLFSAGRTHAAALTYTVVDGGDAWDDNHPGDGVCEYRHVISPFPAIVHPCNLRAAITESNAHTGLDTIDFSIGFGLQTISPASALPAITDPVIIDGGTQPYAKNNRFNCRVQLARPCILLNGANAGAVNGLTIASGGTTVKALAIYGFTSNGNAESRGSSLRTVAATSSPATTLGPLMGTPLARLMTPV